MARCDSGNEQSVGILWLCPKLEFMSGIYRLPSEISFVDLELSTNHNAYLSVARKREQR